ncbi:replication factor C large subunit [Candidatus Woesearchaeota archaeon]|nr:replication factor C large subunit [Candidatus Woesearchaeota archaeon]
MPWIITYAPTKAAECLQTETEKVVQFVETFAKQKKKAILLWGPPGSCKSSTVYAIAKERNLEVIETNASDFRTKDAISSRLGAAMFQQSLFSSGKIVLVDEVDGLSGTKDRGGAQEIAKLVDRSPYPIILTANEPFSKKLKALRKKAVLIEFSMLDTTSVQRVLEQICKKEQITADEKVLRMIARRSGGDLRAAINDLQSVTINKQIDPERVHSLGDRDHTEQITMALLKVFKTQDPLIALEAFDNVQEPLDQLMPWIDENLPLEYTRSADLARAYHALCRADVFKRRIMRRQHWRYLATMRPLLTAGIAVAKDEKNTKRIDYKETRRFLKIWQAKMKYNKRQTIAEKIAEQLHCSTHKALTHIVPYLQHQVRHGMIPSLDLDAEEIAWLAH